MRITRRQRRMRKQLIQITALVGVGVFALAFAIKVGISAFGGPTGDFVQAGAADKPSTAADFYHSAVFQSDDIENSAGSGAADIDRAIAGETQQLMINVHDHSSGKTVQMPLDEYVYHCLCAEVPASYEPEALKAQAVAIRTYAVNNMQIYGGSGCSKHSGADVCTDSAHCQSFASDATLRSNWGENYAANSSKMKAAVEATSGIVALYDGKPILAMFHANSGGLTEDVESIYSSALPYLRSVEGYDPESESVIFFTAKEAAEIINKAYPAAKVKSSAIEEQLIVTARLASGRVETVLCGDIELTGTQLRKLFSLSSSNLMIRYKDGGVEFTTYGRGHGVGLSQEGAQEMAKAGHSYLEILGHYYVGITVGAL